MEGKSSIQNHLFKNLTDAAILLALATGFLFVIGKAYAIGVHSYWGISDAAFSYSIYETIYSGYLQLSLAASKLVILIYKWIYLLLFLFLLFILGLYLTRKKLRKKLENKKLPEFEGWFVDSISGIYKSFNIYSIALLAILSFALVNWIFILMGMTTAEKIHHNIIVGTAENLLIKSKEPFYVVTCDSNICAIYYKDTEILKVVEKSWLIGATKRIEPPASEEEKETDEELIDN